MIDCNQILPNLYVGTCPENLKDVQELKVRCGITAVLNLQSDQDLRDRRIDWRAMETTYSKLGVVVQRVPMQDFDYDDQGEQLPDAVRILAELLDSSHIVYLHCNAGLGRSPLVAMAYLHWCRNMSVQEVIRHVKTRRLCNPYEDLLLEVRPKSPPC